MKLKEIIVSALVATFGAALFIDWRFTLFFSFVLVLGFVVGYLFYDLTY